MTQVQLVAVVDGGIIVPNRASNQKSSAVLSNGAIAGIVIAAIAVLAALGGASHPISVQ